MIEINKWVAGKGSLRIGGVISIGNTLPCSDVKAFVPPHQSISRRKPLGKHVAASAQLENIHGPPARQNTLGSRRQEEGAVIPLPQISGVGCKQGPLRRLRALGVVRQFLYPFKADLQVL